MSTKCYLALHNNNNDNNNNKNEEVFRSQRVNFATGGNAVFIGSLRIYFLINSLTAGNIYKFD